mgnify:CR=1 FL=1
MQGLLRGCSAVMFSHGKAASLEAKQRLFPSGLARLGFGLDLSLINATPRRGRQLDTLAFPTKHALSVPSTLQSTHIALRDWSSNYSGLPVPKLTGAGVLVLSGTADNPSVLMFYNAHKNCWEEAGTFVVRHAYLDDVHSLHVLLSSIFIQVAISTTLPRIQPFLHRAQRIKPFANCTKRAAR